MRSCAACRPEEGRYQIAKDLSDNITSATTHPK